MSTRIMPHWELSRSDFWMGSRLQGMGGVRPSRVRRTVCADLDARAAGQPKQTQLGLPAALRARPRCDQPRVQQARARRLT